MPRSAGTAIENNFSKGLVTEATGMNFPENACTETFDCIFTPTSAVKRRKGIDMETDYEVISFTDGVVKEFVWRVAGPSGAVNFLVVQYSNMVRFYLITGTTVSANLKSFSIDLLDYETTAVVPTGNLTCAFSSGNGLLFVAHPQCEPLMVEYNPTLDSITVTEVALKVRDFKGVEDSLDVDERPAALTALHQYNLMNQGWYHLTVRTINASNSSPGNNNPITYWHTINTEYPGNNQTWWAYKRARTDIDTRNYEEVFDPTTQTYIKIGNTPAPKGHYILEAFNLDRSTASGVVGITAETSSGARPQAVAFFAGRAFWGGVSATQFNTTIYFSQIIERPTQVANCYQAQDPTDEDIPDLLPSDGGTIVIPEMRQLVYMIPLADALFFFATNGVWRVSGSEGVGFRANDYAITKVSDVPAVSALSFILVENIPVWWNETGIWTLATENGIDYQVKSLSDGSIKKFFEDIPNDSKYYVKGAYNSQTKIIQWVYRNDEAPDSTTANTYYYNRLLNLNTLTGSFYPWTFTNEAETTIRGITAVEGLAVEQTVEELYAGADQLFAGADALLSISSSLHAVQSQFKYLVDVTDENGISFAEEVRDDYTDWLSLTQSTDYSSYFITGYKVNGEGNKNFQSNYITVNYEAEPDGSIYLQGLWDYATSGDTGRWTSRQQVMSYQANYKHLMSKRKLRGNGRSLQLKFTSETGKPFIINGWVVFLTGNQIV